VATFIGREVRGEVSGLDVWEGRCNCRMSLDIKRLPASVNPFPSDAQVPIPPSGQGRQKLVPTTQAEYEC
jgi:hypothetical protein